MSLDRASEGVSAPGYSAHQGHVIGSVQAIKRAHEDVKPGMLQVTAGELLDANANRSPTAYLANPPEERARYKHNTDKSMTLLKVLDTAER